jgi:hypothetical protein
MQCRSAAAVRLVRIGGMKDVLHVISPTTHTVECFAPCTSVFPCQYHSTIAPYSTIHIPPTLYNVFLPALQFSPVSIIPPLLRVHSFICDQPHIISEIDRILNNTWNKQSIPFIVFSCFTSSCSHFCPIAAYAVSGNWFSVRNNWATKDARPHFNRTH